MTYVAPERLQQFFMSNKLQVNCPFFSAFSFRGCVMMLKVKKEEVWIFLCLLRKSSSYDDDSSDSNYDEGTNQNFRLQRHKRIIKEKMAREGGTVYNAVYYQWTGSAQRLRYNSAHSNCTILRFIARSLGMKTVQKKFWFSILVWYICTCTNYKKSRFRTIGRNVEGLFAQDPEWT